ncbi:MAG: methyltransferase domain-containing protein [Gelidibacter sp.]
MSFLVDTTYRTEAVEIMDDFSIDGVMLHDALDKLAIINKLLGGNGVTLDGLKILLKNHSKDIPITIVDLGCGGGDILRSIAEFGKKEGYNFQLIGVDANKNATDYGETLSKDYENIRFVHVDVFSEAFKAIAYDVIITTLFLHHFKETQVLQLLNHLLRTATIGVVVNDLERHRLAYYLFKLITIPVTNKMIIEDGLTSVLRGFKRKELVDLSKQLNIRYQLKWKWAFRYQWVLWSSKVMS